MKKIGVIGSRRRNSQKDFDLINLEVLRLYEEGDWLVSGGCSRGGDKFAEVIAVNEGIPILIFFPKWGKHGKVAGLIRNGLIAKEADVLIACVSSDRTGGTEDTIKKFLKLGKDLNNVYLV